jgi:hypothetical protein
VAASKVIDLRKRRIERLAVDLARELVSTTYLIVEVENSTPSTSGAPPLDSPPGSVDGRYGLASVAGNNKCSRYESTLMPKHAGPANPDPA